MSAYSTQSMKTVVTEPSMKTVDTAPSMKTVATAGLQIATFITMIVINYVATAESSGAVAYTNSAIANTHPVYGLPIGWAFAIWGIIFLTLGLFTAYQAIPLKYNGGLECELVERIRVPVLALEVFNSAWIFLFGYEQFWIAMYVIFVYDALLFVVLSRLDVNYVTSVPGMTAGQSMRTKAFAVLPFSIHAGWVTVASVLNIQINLLEEGWMPSPGFASGLLAVVVGIATVQSYTRADAAYAGASAWALGGLIANQAAESTFGCASRICAECTKSNAPPICMRADTSSPGFLAVGWSGLNCTAFTDEDVCGQTVVPKSALLQQWAVAGLLIVLAAYIAGAISSACGLTIEYDGKSGKESKKLPGDTALITPASENVTNGSI